MGLSFAVESSFIVFMVVGAFERFMGEFDRNGNIDGDIRVRNRCGLARLDNNFFYQSDFA